MYKLSIIALLLLCGCARESTYQPPCSEIHCEWHSQISEGMQLDRSDSFIWWESLNDPLLNSLIERASSNNLDLYIAAYRILEARTEEKAGKTTIYPHIDATVNYAHAQYNQNALNQILGIECNKHHGKKNVNLFEAGFDAEWELDLFGMNAFELNALKAKTEASIEEYNYIWITLSSEIAKNYIELRGSQQRLELINKNISAQNDTFQMTQGLIQNGLASTLDQKQVHQQLSLLYSQQSQIEFSITKIIHRLSILLGYSPGDLFCELNEMQSIPVLPCEKPIGIPSELLRRRPDIRKAERDLAAATERVSSAIGELFPRLSLRGFIGDLTAFHSGGFTWFAGPQLLAPIFNSTRIKQDIQFNKIKAKQALYQYQKTVLEALEEAENAIASFHYELERHHQLEQAKNDGLESYQLTYQLYQNGLRNYFEVLVVNRSYLADEDALLQSQIDLLLNYISLYKSLGGSWNWDECY